MVVICRTKTDLSILKVQGLSLWIRLGGADSFISAFAVYLSEGKTLMQAIGFALYASGITVTRYGVQPALPDRKAVDIYEDEIYSRYNI